MARMIDEQYPVAHWERKAEQQEAANVELRNRRARQPAGQLDTRNATLKCRKPWDGRELNSDILLAGQVCYPYTTEFGTFCQASPCHLKSLQSFAQRALSGCTFSCREGRFVSHCSHNGKVLLLQLTLIC